MGGGGGLLGGVGSFLFGDSSAAQQDAAAQSAYASVEATRLALAQQEKMYQDTKAQAQPYNQMSLSALSQAFGGVDSKGQYYFDPNKLNQYTTDKPFQYQDFKGTQFDPSKIDITQDPSYQFRLNQGINALDKSAASRGMLLSGAQQKAINNYAQDTASQEYSNAYQRGLQTQNQQYAQDLSAYQQNMNNALTSYNSDMNLGTQRYNQLASILGLGQTSSQTLASSNANYANQYTNTQMQNANNLASAYSYSGNAQANAQQQNINNLLNLAGTGTKAYTAFSDTRLKKNIELVGTLPNGLNVYDFDYVWGGDRHRGVMAQEALSIVPNAVIKTDSGYYAVDYSKLGV